MDDVQIFDRKDLAHQSVAAHVDSGQSVAYSELVSVKRPAPVIDGPDDR